MNSDLRRLSFFGFVSLASLGALLPYLGGRWSDAGRSCLELGILLGLFPFLRMLLGPAWWAAADRSESPRVVVFVGTLFAAIGVTGIAMASSFAEDFIATVFLAVGRVPLGPVVDAMVLDAIQSSTGVKIDYGRIRIFGSMGFVVSLAIAGLLGGDIWLPVVLAWMLVATTAGLPKRRARVTFAWWRSIGRFYATAGFVPMAAWCFLMALQVSVYDSFFSVYVAETGMDKVVIPASLLVGVAVELGVMWWAGPWLPKVRLRNLLVLASLSGIPRWVGLALAPPIPVVVGLQMFHGLGFALFWLVAVRWFDRASPAEIRSSAQGVLIMVSYGAGALLGALFAGAIIQVLNVFWLFAALGGVAALASALAWWGGVTDWPEQQQEGGNA